MGKMLGTISLALTVYILNNASTYGICGGTIARVWLS